MTDFPTAMDATDLTAAATGKTITGIFAAIYKAFNEAARLASHPDMGDKADDLCSALKDIPQSDLDALVQNVIKTYKALEGLFILGMEFESISPGVLAKVTLRFGENDITLAAPFDGDGAKAMLGNLQEAVGTPGKIVLPH